MSVRNLLSDPPQNDVLRIGFLGQSGYLIKKGNTTILIDPYLSDYVENQDGLNDRKMKRLFLPVIESIDAVFCTHAHVDHMDPWTLENIDSPFNLYCSEAAYRQSSLHFNEDKLFFLELEETITINNFQITSIPAAHYDKSDKNGNPDCLSFLISVDEKKLFFWGDGIPYGGLIDRLAPIAFDLFFAPINGRDWFREKEGIVGNMNSRELAEICGKLKIDTVIPNHFDMFDYNSEIPSHFLNYLNQFCPNQKVKILNHDEIITI